MNFEGVRARAGWAAGLLILFSLANHEMCAQASVNAPTAQDTVGHEVDGGLARVIAEIRAIDNHAHPVLSPPADATDRGFDALPVDSLDPETDPARWSSEVWLVRAWKALWGYTAGPAESAAPPVAEDMKQLGAARAAVKAREGERYSAWVLDQAGIGTMLANRQEMGTGVEPPRFRWVAYADALLFPLDNTGLKAETHDRAKFYALEEKLRERYLRDSGVEHMPATLDAYVRGVATPTLERQKAGGAVAEKFEAAYLRTLDFGDPPKSEAERVYARWVKGGVPDAASYKLLQDYLFRVIAAECGRLGMAVHIHVMLGGGSYFNIASANPLFLEPVFDDPRLRTTNFVMLHGGWPFVREATALLQKPNVYLDLSMEGQLFSPRLMAGWLRERLELYPGKVLFGTDGYPFGDALGWEEGTWIASRTAREALGLALTGMLRDGEVSHAQAEQIARGVLRENAAKLYGLR